ncbi:MAG: DNA alkylation repair protein [Bacillota bacterium]
MPLIEDLKKLKTNEESATSRCHKTDVGQYGEGDVFWHIPSAPFSKVIQKYAKETTFPEIDAYLKDPVHDIRACGVAILATKMRKAEPVQKKAIVDFYLARLEQANGWDLVDGSAPGITGVYVLETGHEEILDKLAGSDNLWRRRVAIISTLTLIRANRLEATYRITKTLIHDKEDLIHKAYGWMLREAGKKDRGRLNRFLKENYVDLPRTTLRYAIEKHEEAERKDILKGNFREE